MAIGEFGGAPAAVIGHGPMLAAPFYWFYEMSQASLNPSRALADATKLFFKNPANPMAYTEFGKTVAAACEMFERSTRRYGKPEWRIDSTLVGGERVPVHISTVWERPFCRLLHFEGPFQRRPRPPPPPPAAGGRPFSRLLHFERASERRPRRPQPRLLIVAPLSGHYATLLRGTVEGLLPYHDIYVTEWADARMVPLSDGRFD